MSEGECITEDARHVLLAKTPPRVVLVKLTPTAHTSAETSSPDSREHSCGLCLMSKVMVASYHHSSDAATDQPDETSAEQDADDLHRSFCPSIHCCDRHKIDRRFPVGDLEGISSLNTEQ